MRKIHFTIYISFLIIIIGVAFYYLYYVNLGFRTEDKTMERLTIDQTVASEEITGSPLEHKNNHGDIVTYNPTSLYVLVNKHRALPGNYIPKHLVVPKVRFPFTEVVEKKHMRADAAHALEQLFAQAMKENIDLYAISGYRSYKTQNLIFTTDVNLYGLEETRKTSAIPGQSEHQTGLAIDVTSPEMDYLLKEEFGTTKEGIWLRNNAFKFGFIIRYPKGKENITGYSYEPWHIRYVGTGIAKVIHDENITLEEFLGEYEPAGNN
jgi:LAS superfamily LD-carboxypeptidase LdcB